MKSILILLILAYSIYADSQDVANAANLKQKQSAELETMPDNSVNYGCGCYWYKEKTDQVYAFLVALDSECVVKFGNAYHNLKANPAKSGLISEYYSFSTGDSLIRKYEDDGIELEIECIVLSTCNDPGSRENCISEELTGILKVYYKSTKITRIYKVKGICGC
jgi:hypothetical protein